VLKGGGPSFAVIYENLKAMRAFQDKFSVHVQINFDRENLPCLDEFMDMLKGDFAGDQRFQLRFYPVGQWGGPNDDKLAVCGTGGTDSRNWLELKAIEKGLYPESKLPYMTPHSGASVCYAARPYNLLIGAQHSIHRSQGRLMPWPPTTVVIVPFCGETFRITKESQLKPRLVGLMSQTSAK
jgi:uncharacterized protein